MFSTSLLAFSAYIGTSYHLRCSWVFHLAPPWSSSRSRSLPGSVPELPACTDVSDTPQPLQQQQAFLVLQCNMSTAAMCYRMGKAHRGKMGKKNKKPACHLLKDFCTQEYLLCKKWLLRSQKYRVLFPRERFLWIGVMLLEGKVSHLVFN